MKQECVLNCKPLKYLSLLLIFLLVSACGETKITESGDYVWEVEPNETIYQAMEIDEEGKVYGGEITAPQGNTGDSDLYKVWFPEGTLVTFEFESDSKDFEPYIGHTDSWGNDSFAVFD